LPDSPATNQTAGNPDYGDSAMDSLIDLNIESRSSSDGFQPRNLSDLPGETSVLKPREMAPDERKLIGIKYSLIGLLVGLGISLAALLILLLINEESSRIPVPVIIFICVFLVGDSIVTSWIIGMAQVKREINEGYIRINNENIAYWNKGREVCIPMAGVFGAKGIDEIMFSYLRIYYLADNQRGFSFVKKSFKYYAPESGPTIRLRDVGDNGHDMVRKAIMYHRNLRKKAGLEYAEVPAYRFQSVKTRKEQVLFGKEYVFATSNCDGKILIYTIQDQEHHIPVEMIESVKVIKVQSQYGVTKWQVNLHMNPSSGYEKVEINALQLPYSGEIEQYCYAVSTSFPERTPGYWD
jgi:hypothetical protein